MCLCWTRCNPQSPDHGVAPCSYYSSCETLCNIIRPLALMQLTGFANGEKERTIVKNRLKRFKFCEWHSSVDCLAKIISVVYWKAMLFLSVEQFGWHRHIYVTHASLNWQREILFLLLLLYKTYVKGTKEQFKISVVCIYRCNLICMGSAN